MGELRPIPPVSAFVDHENSVFTVEGSPGGVTVDGTGGGGAHANVQPYLAINYVIALQGVFPTRN